MKDIYETVELKWHKSEEEPPRIFGEYLCKCVDVENLDGDEVTWSAPYYGIYDIYDGLWQCDGVVIAWAEIPKCSFNINEESYLGSNNMTVKDLLDVYNNSFGAGYGVFDEKNTLYNYEYDRRKLIEDFGDRVVKCFEIEDESTRGFLIYLK